MWCYLFLSMEFWLFLFLLAGIYSTFTTSRLYVWIYEVKYKEISLAEKVREAFEILELYYGVCLDCDGSPFYEKELTEEEQATYMKLLSNNVGVVNIFILLMQLTKLLTCFITFFSGCDKINMNRYFQVTFTNNIFSSVTYGI